MKIAKLNSCQKLPILNIKCILYIERIGSHAHSLSWELIAQNKRVSFQIFSYKSITQKMEGYRIQRLPITDIHENCCQQIVCKISNVNFVQKSRYDKKTLSFTLGFHISISSINLLN